MHLYNKENRFGFHVDNTIGSTPQLNQWCDNWTEFYIKRLEFQFGLIHEKYHDTEMLEYSKKLINKIPQFFEGVTVKPSLLHGDLWSGNWSGDR